MKVLVIHNEHRELGDVDRVVRAEIQLLRAQGAQVEELFFDNDAAIISPVRTGWRAAWSRQSFERVLSACLRFRPQVAHIHNFWAELTPSAHAAAHSAGVATVQTLHDYRLVCVNGLLLREGRLCEDCVSKTPWRGVAYRCYGRSAAASGAVARMLVVNRRLKTWEQEVDAFIAPSEFARQRLAAGGLPPERLFVRRNWVEDPGPPLAKPSESRVVLYSGRLSPERNLRRLLEAWKEQELGRLGTLVIAGEGPERADLEALRSEGVEFAGRRPRAEIQHWLAGARALVFPALTENCPLSVLEAMARGRPAVVSAAGPLPELIRHRISGLTCNVSDAWGLAEALRAILTDGALADLLGAQARREYLARFTPQRGYAKLLAIYRRALDRERRAAPGAEGPLDAEETEPAAVGDLEAGDIGSDA